MSILCSTDLCYYYCLFWKSAPIGKMTFPRKLLNRTHPELIDTEWVVSCMQHILSFSHIYRTHAPCQEADLHHQCVQMMIKVLPEN